MSLFRASRSVEKRTITDVPWDAGGALGKPAITDDTALRLAPVYAAHRHIADNISTLPITSYRRLPDRRVPMSNLPQLLQFMEESGTIIDWVCKAVISLASSGNAIGIILARDGMGFPTRVDWRPTREFYTDDSNPSGPQWYWNGKKIDYSQLVHIPWISAPGRTLGLSPLEAAQLTIESGLQAQEYGNGWFSAGGVPPGTFKNTQKEVTPEAANIIKSRLTNAIRSRQPIVYGSDWDYTAISISPEQAQFVESQNLTANQIAAIYGVLPEEIGGSPAGSMTYANEEMRQTLIMAKLRPWFVRLEAGISKLLPERQYIKFNVDAVIRADTKARHDVYQISRNIGLLSINEIRALEDLPPIDGGDEYTAPSANPTLENNTNE